VSLRCSRCGRPGTAGNGRVEARRLSTLNGEVAGSSPARQTTGGSSIGRALVRCAPPTFARFPVIPGRRHRACGAGTGRRPPVICLENSSPRWSPPHPCRAPEARPGGSKTAGYQDW